jgi:toxin ParE1/3/4
VNVVVTPAAEADLSEIAAHIEEDDPAAAARWLDRMEGVVAGIRRLPRIGTDRSDVAPGVRLFPVGRYLVLYRIEPAAVVILRIVHGARRWGDLV